MLYHSFQLSSFGWYSEYWWRAEITLPAVVTTGTIEILRVPFETVIESLYGSQGLLAITLYVSLKCGVQVLWCSHDPWLVESVTTCASYPCWSRRSELPAD